MASNGSPLPVDVAAALAAAYADKHGGVEAPRSAVVLPLAQVIGAEGSLSKYFLGTNNLGAMHATTRFARAHAGDVGFGMVAFLDHSPGPVAYITRMAVYASLADGARALLDLVERMAALAQIQTATEYATALYTHGYFEGMAAPATPTAARPAAAAAGTWTDADRANIAAYAALIQSKLPVAGDAFDALGSYAGDPRARSSGPPFASLADRLTPGPAYAPHTLEHARELLAGAASSPPPGAISLDEALSTPSGDGVWLFGAPATTLPSFAAIASAKRAGAITIFAIVGTVAAAAAATLALEPRWPTLLWRAIA